MATATLLALPEYVLESFVRDYLTAKDWRNTMNVSIQFTDTKRRSVFLTLTNVASQQFCLDKDFRKKIVSSVRDKRRQIALDLRSTPTIFSKHLAAIDGVHFVNLANNQQLDDVNMLSHVMKLDVSGCHSIRDVSKLSDVVQLTLPRCYELRSLRGLEQVNRLNISGCHLIQDVSMLKKLEVLTVTNCPNISDLSPLANNIQELTFTHCKGIDSVPSLKKVKSLNVAYCDNLQDVSDLPFAERVTLNYCKKLKKIGKMPNVHELHLIGCKDISLSELLCQLSNAPLEVVTVCKCQGSGLFQRQQAQQQNQQISDHMIKKVRVTTSCLCN